MVVAADDVGDAHVVIIDYDGEHIGRRAVGAQQHQIVQVLVLPDHAALDLIVDHRFACQRRLEPDRRLHACGRLARLHRDRASVRHRSSARPSRRAALAHLRKLLRTCIAVIGAPLREQLRPRLDHSPSRAARANLVDRLAVPADAEPPQAVETASMAACVDRSRSSVFEF